MFLYILLCSIIVFFFFFQAEDGIRDKLVTGVQTCALPISLAGRGWVLEPELDALVPALREAADPAARAAKAAHARAQAALFTWANAAEHAAARIDALTGRAPIREVAPAEVPGRRRRLFAVDADWAR